MVSMEVIDIEMPKDSNIILGYSHFIKTVEDLNEIILTHLSGAEYAIAFSEASGDRLIRFESNNGELLEAALKNIKKISAGHTFLIFLRKAFPIAVLNQIKNCQEVGRIFAATANPLSVVVAKLGSGNGILGVIDGFSPVGVEDEEHKIKRKKFLRDIGYKS